MGFETVDDRAIFFSVDDFGEAVTYTPQGGDAAVINVIFDTEFVEVNAGGSVGFAQNQAVILFRTSDVSAAAEGDAFTISGADYTARVIQDDGTGTTTIILERD